MIFESSNVSAFSFRIEVYCSRLSSLTFKYTVQPLTPPLLCACRSGVACSSLKLSHRTVRSHNIMSGEPCRKRARSGEAADEAGKKDERDWRQLPHDKEFWYEDGSIILIASDVAFKAYRGPLIHHSPVFKDMLSMPQPPSSSTEPSACQVELPVVPLTESASDLRHVLRLLMPSSRIRCVCRFECSTLLL